MIINDCYFLTSKAADLDSNYINLTQSHYRESGTGVSVEEMGLFFILF